MLYYKLKNKLINCIVCIGPEQYFLMLQKYSTISKMRACSSVVEHYSYKVGVDGSIPSKRTAEVAKVVTAVV